MFNQKPTEKSELELEIAELLEVLKGYPKHSDEYAAISDQIVKLSKLNHETTSKFRPSADAIVAAAASIGGILMILSYERANVITSKALSFITKLR